MWYSCQLLLAYLQLLLLLMKYILHWLHLLQFIDLHCLLQQEPSLLPLPWNSPHYSNGWYTSMKSTDQLYVSNTCLYKQTFKLIRITLWNRQGTPYTCDHCYLQLRFYPGQQAPHILLKCFVACVVSFWKKLEITSQNKVCYP